MRSDRIAYDASEDARAVRIAADLARLWGESALGRATKHQRAAEAAGDLARVDLFRAVCTIITDRDRVFSRWRASAGHQGDA